MCIIGLAINQHPQFRFILCSNRDEFVIRKSEGPSRNGPFWCGKDCKSDGTWLIIDPTTGNICGLTNLSGTGTRSRGQLCYNVGADPSIADELLKNRHEYAGFNLLWGNILDDDIKLSYTTNCFPDDSVNSDIPKVIITDGVHSMANDVLGDEYVKVWLCLVFEMTLGSLFDREHKRYYW
eukprot:TRINITY_DN2299_c0_g2_i1.p1 TRINITY_DN2299_c0_g2~~TRINITY_DN2299_c0_g2_i1.p1  ORF type:complete len:180 (+),score=28.18 TRINITY_DN2299_c0_g2_i1:281-820(+)